MDNMNIQHYPILNIKKVVEFYSEKDKVDIKYVCTSSTTEQGEIAADIFYRETPHPKFGNRYFGLYVNYDQTLMITDADNIEKLNFVMVDVDGELHYSQHRHDFRTVGDVKIDGGRAHMRRIGNLSRPVKSMKIKDGNFIDAN